MNNYAVYMALYVGTIVIFTGFILMVNAIWTKKYAHLERKTKELSGGLFDIASNSMYTANTYRRMAKVVLMTTSALTWDQIMAGEKKEQEAKNQEIKEQMLYPEKFDLEVKK